MSIDSSSAIIAITTRSSIRVNAYRFRVMTYLLLGLSVAHKLRIIVAKYDLCVKPFWRSSLSHCGRLLTCAENVAGE